VLALGELSFGQNTVALIDLPAAKVSGTRDRVRDDRSFWSAHFLQSDGDASAFHAAAFGVLCNLRSSAFVTARLAPNKLSRLLRPRKQEFAA
jgi:hypothetical protein